jgi:hypothetical protein
VCVSVRECARVCMRLAVCVCVCACMWVRLHVCAWHACMCVHVCVHAMLSGGSQPGGPQVLSHMGWPAAMAMGGFVWPAVLLPSTYGGVNVPGYGVHRQADGKTVPDLAHYFIGRQMATGGWFASRSARILSALITCTASDLQVLAFVERPGGSRFDFTPLDLRCGSSSGRGLS